MKWLVGTIWADVTQYSKLGFKREDLFKDRWFVYDEWQDSVMLGLLKHEWLDRRNLSVDA